MHPLCVTFSKLVNLPADALSTNLQYLTKLNLFEMTESQAREYYNIPVHDTLQRRDVTKCKKYNRLKTCE